LAQRYSFALATNQVIEPLASITLRPRRGLWVKAHLRSAVPPIGGTSRE